MTRSKTQALMDAVISRIQSGEWPPGTKLPSARELRKEHDVSQQVVRVAVDRLRIAGWVVTVPGAGWWVSQHPPIASAD